ncbi:uncharacterized protein BT62DRAFT_924581 [Guyanagaster necrorhizus]|uniref:Uncharacterized protein n=1 Tax=Guyanagaster necrorhizus TaxID=856835 RepID=A0A9P7VFH7_9AGAR|nr:uncharacterized protein BT62DRAFT_924581 [Guyanagaster necrorhizus MCA 3950]KAG7439622.1 hypothetical protein BT62DRAFT_924581 [Guyanagaster necrorhizus MCA 3950]
MDLGCLPNVFLAKVTHYASLYILLPNLVRNLKQHEGTPSVSIQEYAVLYEIFIQSALHYQDMTAACLPATYSSKLFQAGSGQSHQMRKLMELIPSEYVERLLGDFNGWGIRHHFLLQWRGIKALTVHDPSNATEQEYFLRQDHVFNANMFSTPGDDVFVDVALELSVKEGAVMWCSDSHAVALQRLLQMHQTEANKWTRFGYYNYKWDTCAYLTSVIGCHIITHTTLLGQFNATFAQMYTTDKCLIYDMWVSNNAKFVTAVNLMKKSKYTYNEFLGKLYGVFADAAWHNDVHTWIEAQVPLANVEDVFTDVSVASFLDLVYCVP